MNVETKEAHTPGPWFVQSKKRNRICGPEGLIVAEAWVPPAKAKREAKNAAWDQANANANLIAAAPDMLSALKFFMCIDFDLFTEHDEILLGSVIADASAAIAKASPVQS